jgi:Kef-type K+ transport system membrane component KefB
MNGFGDWMPKRRRSLVPSLSHPIAIVTRLGVSHNEAVAATVGATIFTDIAALLVLAVCLSVNNGDFSLSLLKRLWGRSALRRRCCYR